METLPKEIHRLIAEGLNPLEKASLSQCSRKFKNRINPVLWESHKDMAMFYACRHGKLEILKLAISFGALVSTVKKQKKTECCLDDSLGQRGAITRSISVLTLYLATLSLNIETFGALIELGSQVDDESVHPEQFKAFMRSLTRPSCWDLLRLFLQQAGLVSQIKKRFENALSVALISLVKSGAPVELLTLLLENGADINHVDREARPVAMSPLSAAILNNSVPYFNFLLDRGACIHGRDLPFPIKTSIHIPIFAAARALAQKGPYMMELCLAKGADINRYTAVKRKEHSEDRGSPFYIVNFSPLFAFLDSVTDWEEGQPAARLAYLFNRGATVTISYDMDTLYRMGGRPMPQDDEMIVWLVLKWSCKKLGTRGFYDSILILLQQGAVTGSILAVSDLLLRGFWHTKSPEWLPITHMPMWRKFLSLFLSGPDWSGRDYLLCHVIYGMGLSSEMPELETGLIECLVRDFRDDMRHSYTWTESKESLLRLCKEFAKRAKVGDRAFYDTRDRSRRFLQWLVLLGYDPAVGYEWVTRTRQVEYGMSMIQQLEQGIRRSEEDGTPAEGTAYLRSILEVVKEKDEWKSWVNWDGPCEESSG